MDVEMNALTDPGTLKHVIAPFVVFGSSRCPFDLKTDLFMNELNLVILDDNTCKNQLCFFPLVY